MKQISLNGTWLMYRKDIGKQIQAQVPGSVFHDLMENGLMEDPFYRDMEADYYELDERYSLPVIAACRRGAYVPQSVRYFLQILNEGDR